MTRTAEQLTLFDPQLHRGEAVHQALAILSASEAEERGAVFTRTAVVDFMLDLIGYTPERCLWQESILEPSFGDGDFLLHIIERLLTSYVDQVDEEERDPADLADCVRGVELHRESLLRTAGKVMDLLERHGFSISESRQLCAQWLICDDFLLAPLPHVFDYVVGNPPYLRQEVVPDALLAEYRRKYQTIYDRADLYIPFYERGLALLTAGGTLSFICSDRWMKNRYGGPLRNLIAKHYHVVNYIDMVGTDAFHQEVSAYPAIVTIGRDSGGATRVTKRPKIDPGYLKGLAVALRDGKKNHEDVETIPRAVRNKEPWLLDCATELHLIRDLEDSFSALEDVGCRVGIGVATGRDRVYIQPLSELDVEPDRKLPLVMAPDTQSGRIEWGGKGVVNPFRNGGGLVDLAEYPKLAQFFAAHEDEIRKRNVAKKNPDRWYRTIDRIHAPLTNQAKLLIPDIRDEPTVVFDKGEFYPHHNLYWITSNQWDLQALQAVLRSSIAKLFVWAYSVKMRGGYLRYQAQNLRRIYLPQWNDVAQETRKRLVELAETIDLGELDRAVYELYGFGSKERNIVTRIFDRR